MTVAMAPEHVLVDGVMTMLVAITSGGGMHTELNMPAAPSDPNKTRHRVERHVWDSPMRIARRASVMVASVSAHVAKASEFISSMRRKGVKMRRRATEMTSATSSASHIACERGPAERDPVCCRSHEERVRNVTSHMVTTTVLMMPVQMPVRVIIRSVVAVIHGQCGYNSDVLYSTLKMVCDRDGVLVDVAV